MLGWVLILSPVNNQKLHIYQSVQERAYYFFRLTGNRASSIVIGGRVSGLPRVFPVKSNISSEFNRPSAISCCINTSNWGLSEHPLLHLCFPKCCSKGSWLNFSLKTCFPGLSLIRVRSSSTNNFTTKKVRVLRIRRLPYK